MIAPKENLTCRTYNVHAMSFTPKELFDVVKRRVPELEIVYKVDGRQKIGMRVDFLPRQLRIIANQGC